VVEVDVKVEGVPDILVTLDRAVPNDLSAVMAIAAGNVHRYLMGISKDTPPVGESGVLPVITGRLKNSLFWTVQTAGNDQHGVVFSNIVYGAIVEARRGFMRRATQDMTKPVNDLFANYIGRR